MRYGIFIIINHRRYTMIAGELLISIIASMAKVGVTPTTEVAECLIQFKTDGGAHVVRIVKRDEVTA